MKRAKAVIARQGPKGRSPERKRKEPDVAISVERLTGFDLKLIAELTEIEAEAFGDGGLNRWFFPVFIRHGAVYVIKENGKILAIADIIKDWANPALAFLVNFVVKKEERGKGYGSKLLERLIAQLKAQGVQKVQLTVDPSNQKAVRLYSGLGFREIAKYAKEYGPDDDRLLFELEMKD